MAVSVVTTVNSTGTNYDLTDLPTVKDELQITSTGNDAFLRRALTQASKVLANYCNRVFQVETVTDTIYIDQDPYPYQTPGTVAAIQLSRFPVVSVATVTQVLSATETQTLAQNTDYKLDAEKGLLLRLNTATGIQTGWDPLPVIVQYNAGYAAIPDDLVDATLRLVTMRYKARGRDPMQMQLEQPGTGIQRWWVGPLPNQNGAIPPEITGMLDGTYRVPVVV